MFVTHKLNYYVWNREDLGLYFEWFKCFCLIQSMSVLSVQINILTQVRNLLQTYFGNTKFPALQVLIMPHTDGHQNFISVVLYKSLKSILKFELSVGNRFPGNGVQVFVVLPIQLCSRWARWHVTCYKKMFSLYGIIDCINECQQLLYDKAGLELWLWWTF